MSRFNFLIIDDDSKFAAKLQNALEGLFNVEVGHTVKDFRRLFAVNRYDLLILDMRLETGQEGLDLLREALDQDPAQAAVVMTAYADIASYADALESGALTYLNKREFSPSLIARTLEAIVQQNRLQKSLTSLKQHLDILEPLEIIGATPAVVQMREQLRNAAEIDSPVLLIGEPGSGHELAARNIHRYSRRTIAPFRSVSCNHLTKSEAMLFGRSDRRPDGSHHEVKGLLDETKGGVILLSDVIALDTKTQTSLLNCLQEHSFVRQGGSSTHEWDGQIVASVSNKKDLSKKLLLLFEQHGVLIEIPPLRERPEDIPLLAHYLLQTFYRQGQTQVRSLKADVLNILENFAWPGNIRELKNALEYATIHADAESVTEISSTHLPISLPGVPIVTPKMNLDYQVYLARSELALVEQALSSLTITKKNELAKVLHYSNRFLFSRRMRKNLSDYPQLSNEFPKTAQLFSQVRRSS